MEQITDEKLIWSVRYFLQNRPLFPVSPHLMWTVKGVYWSGVPNLLLVDMTCNQQWNVKVFIIRTGNETGGVETFLDFILADWSMIQFFVADAIQSRLEDYNAGHDPWFRGRRV